MGRKPTYEWQTRVEIFLAYRRLGGKVLPVSEKFNVARSTVTLIVHEFAQLGFSMKPRVELSNEFLEEAQKRHLAQVKDFHLSEPLSSRLGELPMRPLTPGDVTLSRLSDEFMWHIKGTDTERILLQAKGAIGKYVEQWDVFWKDLYEDTSRYCGYSISEPKGRNQYGHSCYVFLALPAKLRSTFFDPDGENAPEVATWFEVMPGEVVVGEPMSNYLTAKSERVAVGDRAALEQIAKGFERLVADKYHEYQRRAVDLERHRKDLGYVDAIIEKKLNTLRQVELANGVCPSCPYPEANDLAKAMGKSERLKPKRSLTDGKR